MSTGTILFRRIARVTIEFRTPFLVGSSGRLLLADTGPVLDANDLPVIPGTSLTGMIRHAFEREHGSARTTQLFGGSDDAENGLGEGSRLWVTWAHIHDSRNRPVDGLRVGVWNADPVLANAMGMTVRDHVRISHRGAADSRGKFDQALVPAGHRFTFELHLEAGDDRPEDESDFLWILRHLAGGWMRVGGAGRRGLGSFAVVKCLYGKFDHASGHAPNAYMGHSARLDVEARYLEPLELSLGPPPAALRALALSLEAEGFWGFNGTEPWVEHEDERSPDFNPVREERIRWDADIAVVCEQAMFIPGSSVKGALAHRVAFHDNRLRGRYADQAESVQDLEQWTGSRNPSVQALFGTLHGQADEGAGEGCAGKVFIDDAWLDMDGPRPTARLDHVSIDRFTGGARAGVLFSERVLFKGPQVVLRLLVEDLDRVDSIARDAFREALRDLCEGRVQIGAGYGRGHGVFHLVGSSSFEALWRSSMGADGNAK